jgi:hypothetical protein
MVEKVEQRGKEKQCLRSDFELKQPQKYRSDEQTKSLCFYSASRIYTSRLPNFSIILYTRLPCALSF